MITRRKALLGAALLSLAFVSAAAGNETGETVTVYRTPWCGCCHGWAAAIEKAGYRTDSVILEDLSGIRKQAGVPADMEGCHVAMIGGYFLEGHIPLEAIRQLQSERPDIAGLAVPGMPQGSLGMGNDPSAAYDVFAVPREPTGAPSIYYRAGG